MTGFTTTSSPVDAKKPAKHSVRGFLFADNVCYVADEGGARVGIYNPYSGERGQSAIYALNGSTPTTFAGGLGDAPECLLVVPTP